MAARNGKTRPPRNAPGRRADGPAEPDFSSGDAAVPWWARPGVVAAAVVVGVAVRLLVAAVSFGSNDAATFLRFGIQIDEHGLFAAYRQDPDLNHPPIPALWTWAAYRLTGGAAADGAAFAFVFKLPVIAAEALAAWLLWRRWRGARAAAVPPRPPPAPTGDRRAAVACGGYALSLCAVLVSGYHCNTDTLYAALCLLSVWLLADRRRPLSAGLALAAAVNVKLIPVLLIPGLLLSLRTRRDAVRFLAGLAVGVLPFVPVLLTIGPSFYQNALAYSSRLDKWGVPFFLLPAADVYDPYEVPAADAYYAYAKYPLLAGLVAFAAVARWLGRWDRYEVAAVTFGLFLVFTPGFGAQYTAVVLPLMFAVRPVAASVYSVAAGAFLGAVYLIALRDGFPFYSQFPILFPQPSPRFGAIAWGVLIYFVAVVLARPASKAAA